MMKFLLALSLLLGLAGGLLAQTKKPNIIFLLTDDQRDNTLGGMGHPFVKTPYLDQLLKKSLRFKNTYIAEPVCSPSRVSYLTGVHERVHGVGFSSSYQLTEEQWQTTYPALLQKAGYHTGFIGKIGIEYYTFKGKAQDKFDYYWGHDGWTKFLPKKVNANSTKPYHRAKADVITDIMGEAMNEFLDQTPSDQPFCLSVSFNVPHGSQTTSMFQDYPDWRLMSRPANQNPDLKGTAFYDSLYRNLDVQIPKATAKDPYQFIPKHMMDQDKGRNKTYVYNYNTKSCTEHHIRYYQTISGLDHNIGQLLKELEKRKLMDNTVILFGSDHGLLMGEYGMGGKALLYDLSSKIPCFIYDPKTPDSVKGETYDHLVSSLDIPRTILDYAGIEAPSHYSGKSLKPLLQGRNPVWRDELFLESLFTMRDNPFQEGVRNERFKYIRMFDSPKKYDESHTDFRNLKPGFECFFDLESDPEEMVNLIHEPEHQELIAEMRSKCQSYSDELNRDRSSYSTIIKIKRR